jgi:hypothetical protein
MDCRTFRNRLEDYLDGGLDFAGRFGMERHARQCFGCGKVVVDAQKLGEAARGLSRVAAPRDFEAAVLRRISSNETAGWRQSLRKFSLDFDWAAPRRLFAVVSLAAVCALGTFVVFHYVPGRQSTPSAKAVAPPAPPSSETHPAPEFVATPPAAETDPVDLQLARPAALRSAFGPKEDLPVEEFTTDDTEYVEYLVPGPGDRTMVVRLPKTIRMRYGQPSQEYFIRNVSH